MTWIKVDDQFPDHPKFLDLSDAAVAAWVRGLCYSSRYLTDGDLPRAALRKGLGTSRAAAELVAAGLWYETEDGWKVHDYDVHQRTSDEVESQREQKAFAGTLGSHKRWHLAKGVVDPKCPHCAIAEPIAPAMPLLSEPDNRTWPEVEVEVEVEAEAEAYNQSAVINCESLSLRDDGTERETRVVKALEQMADLDLTNAIAKGIDVRNRAAYRAECLTTRVRHYAHRLDALADNHPDDGPEHLVANVLIEDLDW